MGKVLVTKSAASSAMNAINSFTAPHTTGYGGVLGGVMGGLGALNALGNASESQQDIFGGAQQAAQAGITGYYGGARLGDEAGPAAHAKLNQLRGVAPPQHRAQQVAVRAQRAQQPAQSQDFTIPEDFQLGVYGTPMGGGNQVIQGQKGIQPNLFNPKQPAAPTGLDAAGLGNIDPTMLQGEAKPYGSAGVPTMSMEEMGQMLPGTGQPPPESTKDATADYLDTLSPEVQQMIMSQKSEPFEIAFRLLKSVVV